MKHISSIMAGTVVEIRVKPGDLVAEGMTVAVLESMKMQLPVTAMETGKVKELKIKAGDFVNEGDVILVLESP